MRRLPLHLLLIGAICLMAPVAAAAPAKLVGQVELKPHVIVEDRVVRLGDLFENAGSEAETAVAYAPEPGEQAILDARWLYRAARAYKLDWQPLGAKTQVVLERASVRVPFDEVKARILDALADRGLSGEADIEFATRFEQFHLPVGSVPTVNVEGLDYYERTGRFTALIGAPGLAANLQKRISGRVFNTVEVPVLRERLLSGDVIREAQIEYVRMNAERVQRDVITDVSDIIGMTPKRGMRAGQPIRSIDIIRPVMVPKNSLVIIVHRVPNMTLTAQGKALEAGSEGDVIQIKNSQSNQVIEAEVIAPGRVAVKTLSQQLSMSLN